MSEKEADILENETQILQLHYYFNDNSHSMDAFVRNTMEKDFLNLVKEIGKTLSVEVLLESQAKEEGGLKENIIISIIGISGIMQFLSPSINDIVVFYMTGKKEMQNLEMQLKQEEIKQMKIKNENDMLELQKLKEKQNKDLEENHRIKRFVSNFYQKAENYEKIERIGYEYNGYKRIVQRNEFKNFILDSKSDIEVIEDTRIEIISPVLKEGKYKWKGIYENNKIDFSMRDRGFKKDVINQKYNFTNGSIIVCKLEIKNTYDEFGEKVKKTTYSVIKVYEVIVNNNIRKTKAGQKRDKEKFDSKQKSLFDDLD